MANILISYWKIQEVGLGKILSFWDGLIQEFSNNGNKVFVINSAYFNKYDSNVVKNKKLNNYLLNKVKEFNPELIISFNHRIPQCILDNFKDVQKVIYDGDELRYFCDLNYIKNNISSYKLFSIVEDWKKDYLDFGFSDKQIFQMPPATAIKKEDIEQNKNISFLGAIHYGGSKLYSLIKSHKYQKELFAIQQEYLNKHTYNFDGLFKKHFGDKFEFLNLQLVDLYPFFNYRWLTLAILLDLGLVISGLRWDEVVQYMPQLTAAYFNESVWSLKENADFYNSSKISISPMHPQARGSGFPWRIYDIMASNACLVSEYSSDLKGLISGYVDLPMFKSPWEAREVCKELLADEHARNEIVLGSQKYVDQNARWIHRFKDMEEILNIKLISQYEDGNVFNIIEDEEFIQILNSKNKNKFAKLFKF